MLGDTKKGTTLFRVIPLKALDSCRDGDSSPDPMHLQQLHHMISRLMLLKMRLHIARVDIIAIAYASFQKLDRKDLKDVRI